MIQNILDNCCKLRNNYKICEQKNDRINPYINKRMYSFFFISQNPSHHKKLKQIWKTQLNLKEIHSTEVKEATFFKHNGISPKNIHKLIQKALNIQEEDYSIYSRNKIQNQQDNKKEYLSDDNSDILFDDEVSFKPGLTLKQQLEQKVEQQNMIILNAKKNIRKIEQKEQERLDRLKKLIS